MARHALKGSFKDRVRPATTGTRQAGRHRATTSTNDNNPHSHTTTLATNNPNEPRNQHNTADHRLKPYDLHVLPVPRETSKINHS